MTTSAAVGLVREENLAPTGTRLGSLVEFLLVGGVTLVLFPLAWLARRSLGLDSSELAIGFLAFHAAYVINDPHFAVTYVLFYRDAKNRAFGGAFEASQRVRYWIAGVVVPFALLGWSAFAIVSQSARSIGWMMELMFFLVGWHYVKQGFGVLTILSARRGFRFGTLARRVVLLHCFSGWAYGWASPSTMAREAEEKGVVYFTLPHPRWLELGTGALFSASTLLLILVFAVEWKRERRFPPIAPLFGFLITIWLWVVFSSIDPLIVYVIPGLHSLQYLYFVWLLERNEARASEGPPTFGKPSGVRLLALSASALALGWLLFRGGPDFLDDVIVDRKGAGALGLTPYLAVSFAVVNIHHYFMDFVIWRRENPRTRHLLAR
jgi:hypothetical protein